LSISLKHNIVANLAGGSWNTVLVILVTPVQVGLLGVEAYGLISLIAVLQIIAGALDFGLASTVTREVAHNNGRPDTGTAALVNAASAVYWITAALAAAALWAAADAVPARWLKTDSLAPELVARAIEMIAVFLLLRWPIALYSGVLSGAQQMGLLNALKSAAITLRLAGGAALLLVKPDLLWLLAWYVATATLELAGFIFYAFRAYPPLRVIPRLDLAAIRKASGFSATMYAIALLAMLLTQIDRLAIGRLLGLEALGYYSVAYTAAMGLSLLQTSINNAALPAFANAHGAGDGSALRERYHRISELMGFVLTPMAMTLVFFGHDIFVLWVGATVADATLWALPLLAAGFLLNAVFSSSYIFAVAAAQPGLFLRANVVGLLLFLPVLLACIHLAGIAGAAAAWLLLNVYYLAFVLPRAHAMLQLGPTLASLHRGFALFVYAGLPAFAGGWLLARLIDGRAGSVVGLMVSGALYLWLSSKLASPRLAQMIIDTPGSVRKWLHRGEH
jgi:O-antigen/teichoic acid export membrane protein